MLVFFGECRSGGAAPPRPAQGFASPLRALARVAVGSARLRRRGVCPARSGWAFSLGVSRGFFLVVPRCFVRGSFRPRGFRALGRWRAWRVVPPVVPLSVGFRGGGAVFFRRRCWLLRVFLGSPLAAGLFRVCGAAGAGWLCRFGAGRAAACFGRPRPGLAPAGFRVRGSLRGCGVVSPLLVFVAGLPPGCVAWSPWPRCSGVVVVACPSCCAALAARRRAGSFGLAAAGPVAASRRRWLVAARWVVRPPSALSVRLGAGPAVLAVPSSLSGVPLPVPPRGGSSRSPSRSVSAVSFRQGQLF